MKHGLCHLLWGCSSLLIKQYQIHCQNKQGLSPLVPIHLWQVAPLVTSSSLQYVVLVVKCWKGEKGLVVRGNELSFIYPKYHLSCLIWPGQKVLERHRRSSGAQQEVVVGPRNCRRVLQELSEMQNIRRWLRNRVSELCLKWLHVAEEWMWAWGLVVVAGNHLCHTSTWFPGPSWTSSHLTSSSNGSHNWAWHLTVFLNLCGVS